MRTMGVRAKWAVSRVSWSPHLFLNALRNCAVAACTVRFKGGREALSD